LVDAGAYHGERAPIASPDTRGGSMHQHKIRRTSREAVTGCSRCGGADVAIISRADGGEDPVTPSVRSCAACGTYWIETLTGRVWRIGSSPRSRRSTLR
jgi:hypothetical protein